MKIAETKPFLDADLAKPLAVDLVRKAKVRAITASNQIEGNRLAEQEVTALFDGKRVAGAEKDIREIHNYQAALDYVEKLAQDPRPLRIADFCDVQRLVTDGLVPREQCGRVRTIPVSIVSASTGEKISALPEPHELPALMEELWRWLEDTQGQNAYARAFAFHFIAVAIHPFADGNGRSVRLMQHLLLLRDRQAIARVVPSETAIMKQRDRYYHSIRQSLALESLEPILEYLAECFALAAEESVREARKLLKERAENTPEARRAKIVEHARARGRIRIQDLLEILPDVPRRTLERDLETLVGERALQAIGEKKGREYQPRQKA